MRCATASQYIKIAKAQPDDTSLLIDGLHDPTNDERVRVELRCVASLRPLQLHLLAFGKEHDLRVDAQLPARRLRLGHRCIVWLVIIDGDLSMLSLTGIKHSSQ